MARNYLCAAIVTAVALIGLVMLSVGAGILVRAERNVDVTAHYAAWMPGEKMPRDGSCERHYFGPYMSDYSYCVLRPTAFCEAGGLGTDGQTITILALYRCHIRL
ncbi:MAG: hypothetical protein L0Z53_17570, partial [Acidobacteriales bacterium]|nr:hypothetical protein [Terriglobales bacterium]